MFPVMHLLYSQDGGDKIISERMAEIHAELFKRIVRFL